MADSALKEYEICQATIHHLDTINWSVGAILFGSSLAATGLVLREPSLGRLLTLLILSAVFLVGWLLFVSRQIGFKDICAARMAEIERENPALKMKMQKYFDQAKKDGSVQIGKADDVRPVELFRIRAFDIFKGMVIIYLVILGILAITHGLIQ